MTAAIHRLNELTHRLIPPAPRRKLHDRIIDRLGVIDVRHHSSRWCPGLAASVMRMLSTRRSSPADYANRKLINLRDKSQFTAHENSSCVIRLSSSIGADQGGSSKPSNSNCVAVHIPCSGKPYSCVPAAAFLKIICADLTRGLSSFDATAPIFAGILLRLAQFSPSDLDSAARFKA